jgi:hypothetical protein
MVVLQPNGTRATQNLNRKGYKREDLHDPWLRYLPPEAEGGWAEAFAAAEAAGT